MVREEIARAATTTRNTRRIMKRPPPGIVKGSGTLTPQFVAIPATPLRTQIEVCGTGLLKLRKPWPPQRCRGPVQARPSTAAVAAADVAEIEAFCRVKVPGPFTFSPA